jgi:hypothetical protein
VVAINHSTGGLTSMGESSADTISGPRTAAATRMRISFGEFIEVIGAKPLPDGNPGNGLVRHRAGRRWTR